MNDLFNKNITKINNDNNPIKLSWEICLDYLNIEKLLTKEFNQALLINISKLNNNNFYHNQYHLAQVMYITAFLLKEEDSDQNFINKNSFPLLLSAMFHDANHPGRSNFFPYELEKESITFMQNYFIDNNLNLIWDQNLLINKVLLNSNELLEISSELILATEFKEEPVKVYKNYHENKTNINILKVILIEADILLSCLEFTGFEQTKKVLNENKLKIDIKQWYNFLNNIYPLYYQSKSAKIFKIKENILNIINKGHKNGN